MAKAIAERATKGTDFLFAVPNRALINPHHGENPEERDSCGSVGPGGCLRIPIPGVGEFLAAISDNRTPQARQGTFEVRLTTPLQGTRRLLRFWKTSKLSFRGRALERRRSNDKGEMTRTQYDRDSVIDAAMQIIHDEHRFFINDAIDNAEHIPRIVRIAESAGKLLATGGMTKPDVEANVERIIHYGRQLFIEEWMKPFPDDTEAPDEEDAIEEFDRYARKARKRKAKRSSNR